MSENPSWLTEDFLIRAGGWDSRYARILLIEQGRELAVALVDGNGDGSEVELEYWHRATDGRWSGASSSGHGHLDDIPATESWTTGHQVVTIGRDEPGSVVRIAYGSRTYARTVNEFGFWGCVRDVEPLHPAELPTVTLADPGRGNKPGN